MFIIDLAAILLSALALYDVGPVKHSIHAQALPTRTHTGNRATFSPVQQFLKRMLLTLFVPHQMLIMHGATWNFDTSPCSFLPVWRFFVFEVKLRRQFFEEARLKESQKVL